MEMDEVVLGQWTLSVGYVLGILLIFIVTILANAAGIGGGPMIVAVMIYVLELENTKAIGLSQVAILGGSLIATLMKTTYKHPYKDTHLIDYDIIAHISGGLLFGACIGSLITRLAQSWMTLLGLSILLSIMSYITLHKGLTMFRNESKNLKISERLLEITPDQVKSAKVSILAILASLAAFVIFTLAKGDKVYTSIIGIDMCSVEYLGIFIGYFLGLLICGVLTGIYLLNKYKSTSWAKGEMDWNKKSVTFLPFMSLLTGIMAGSLGIGGGIILNPLFISYGLLPEVSTTTSNLFVLLSSFLLFCSITWLEQLTYAKAFFSSYFPWPALL